MEDQKNHFSVGTDRPLMGQNNKSNMDDQLMALTDQELLEYCRKGDMDAFGLLIEKYQDRLFNAILRMVNNYEDARELTQDAFVRALQGLSKFRGNAGFYTWLFRIGINLCINFRRRRGGKVRFVSLQQQQIPGPIDRQADGLMNLADRQSPLPPEQAHNREMHQRVLNALQELDAPARAVVVLRDIESLDYSEIAEILELPVGTVKSRLFRARMALRDQLLEPEDKS
jgi:RNA polymerase sigma-70 factor (ECF subfamily)